MKVSYSRVSCYMRCPYSHYLSYEEQLKVNKPSRPLTFGSNFHSLLEVRGNKGKIKKAFKVIKDEYENMPQIQQESLGMNYLQDLKNIFSDYKKVYVGETLPSVTEHEFLLPIGKYKGEQINFHGFIDEVYYDEGMIGEHKTFSQAPSYTTLAMNTQVCLYAKAWEKETGKSMRRVQWDYIKSSPSSEPIWLEKSQRFSTAANKNITPYSWLRACKCRGIEDKDILGRADNYKVNLDNFFFRKQLELIPSMVNSMWEDFLYVVKDMAKRSSTNKTKNVTRDCSWCDFRPICYGEFTGADVEYIKQKDYIKKGDIKNGR